MNTDLEERILRTLRAHVSSINSGTLLRRAKSRTIGENAEVTDENARQVFAALRLGIQMFCGDAKVDAIVQQLSALLASSQTPTVIKRRVDVAEQEDISAARRAAIEVCVELGAPRFTMQKVATAVSELARNIADYSRGGFLEISHDNGRVIVRAEDRGPGIPHLEEVLAGTYRSKTGLGRGIAGVRQMMDHTEIETGPKGTHIVAELALWT